jgi:hypothetical protein
MKKWNASASIELIRWRGFNGVARPSKSISLSEAE